MRRGAETGDEGYQGARPERGRGQRQPNRRWDHNRDRRQDRPRRVDRYRDRDERPRRDDRPRREERARPGSRDQADAYRYRERFDSRDAEFDPQALPHGLRPAEDEPDMPKDVDVSVLPRQVRAEIRGLPSGAQEFVSAHLVAAGQLIDFDPALALKHALAAKRRAARLPLIREAVGEAAYEAGEYQTAINEYRALRRMTGDTAYLPVIADCERALGRPEESLRLAREARLVDMSEAATIEMQIIEAGAREDLDQRKEGLRLLRAALGKVTRSAPQDAKARIAYAYAAMLERHGQTDQATGWYARAASLDVTGETDAADKLAAMDGVALDIDYTDFFDDPDEDTATSEDPPAEDPPAEDPVTSDSEPAPGDDEVAASDAEEAGGEDGEAPGDDKAADEDVDDTATADEDVEATAADEDVEATEKEGVDD